MLTFNTNLEQFQMFFLVFVRVAAILLSAPIFSAKNVPAIVKAGLAFSVSIILFPIVDLEPHPYFSEVIPFAIGVTSEIMIGIIIGLTVNLIFAGIELAGQLAGYQMGFAIANVMDPETGKQESIFAGLLNMVALLLFLSFNAHHWFLRSLVESFRLVPIFNFQFTGSLMEHLIRAGGNMFVVAVKVAAPVMAALLLSSVCLGIIARTIPKMNIFLVGMPLKIGLGIMFIVFSLPYLAAFLRNVFGELGNTITLILKAS